MKTRVLVILLGMGLGYFSAFSQQLPRSTSSSNLNALSNFRIISKGNWENIPGARPYIVITVHGTWAKQINEDGTSWGEDFNLEIPQNFFGIDQPSTKLKPTIIDDFWSGENTDVARVKAARDLANGVNIIYKMFAQLKPQILFIAHSNGGNVLLAATHEQLFPKDLGAMAILLGTPMKGYKTPLNDIAMRYRPTTGSLSTIINVSSPEDIVQRVGAWEAGFRWYMPPSYGDSDMRIYNVQLAVKGGAPDHSDLHEGVIARRLYDVMHIVLNNYNEHRNLVAYIPENPQVPVPVIIKLQLPSNAWLAWDKEHHDAPAYQEEIALSNNLQKAIQEQEKRVVEIEYKAPEMAAVFGGVIKLAGRPANKFERKYLKFEWFKKFIQRLNEIAGKIKASLVFKKSPGIIDKIVDLFKKRITSETNLEKAQKVGEEGLRAFDTIQQETSKIGGDIGTPNAEIILGAVKKLVPAGTGEIRETVIQEVRETIEQGASKKIAETSSKTLGSDIENKLKGEGDQQRAQEMQKRRDEQLKRESRKRQEEQRVEEEHRLKEKEQQERIREISEARGKEIPGAV